MAMGILAKEVVSLPGVGPSRAAVLGRLGVRTVGDLLLHLPRTFLDRRSVRAIGSLEPGIPATVSGEVAHVAERRARGGRILLHALLSDGTGQMDLVFFNAGFLRARLYAGARLLATGRVDFFRGLSMAHPELLFLDGPPGSAPDPGGMLPVYPLTAGISQGVMRGLVRRALDACRSGLPQLLPVSEALSAGFGSRFDAFAAAHLPGSPEEAEKARRFLALEELFLHQSYLRQVRAGASAIPGMALESGPGVLREFVSMLPFVPTGAQSAALAALSSDLGRGTAMRRLLQGDVGSGKTVVAAFACRAAAGSGLQAALLAPTEVLASQHERTLSRLLGPMGVDVRLLTAGTSRSGRADILRDASTGAPMLLIGTHAILEKPVSLPGLSLLVVDEQHKFGVGQREKMLEGLDPRPHLLIMSATPIPRTLAMAFYGDLDVSVIDEMPPGRGAVHTRVVGEDGRREAMDRLLERLAAGERAYIVYPLREATEGQDLLDATTAYERLMAGPAGAGGVGLLHGTMPASEKNARAGDFAAGRTAVLVSTTVVEVGLDVPEATVMIVSGAGRFGLSQLHQLRGRIGRGGRDSWCFLIAGRDTGEKAMERLRAMEASNDGFELARRDLELRGPGDLFGTRQSGLPEFRVADLMTDSDLLERASVIAAGHRPGEEARAEMKQRFGDERGRHA